MKESNMQKYAFTFSPQNLILVNEETGKRHSISRSHVNFDKIKEAISFQDWDEVERLVSLETQIFQHSDKNFRVIGNCVEVKRMDGGWFAVPFKLNETILQYLRENLPFERLVKFALNLSENPSRKSVQQLFEFIEGHGLTITENGCFIAYKGVTKDFKDCRTATIDNSVGVTVKMPRNEVQDDPQVACSYGLHVANYEYAHTNYGHGKDGVTVLVEVNPKDVVSVPVDHSAAKIRVCEYKVLKVSPDPVIGSTYDSSCDYEEDDDVEDEEGMVECDDCCGSFYEHELDDGGLCEDCAYDREEDELTKY